MKRKIRAIFIDGVTGSGKSSVFKEIRKFIKRDLSREIYESNDSNNLDLAELSSELKKEKEIIALAENPLISNIYKDMLQPMSFFEIEKKYESYITKEQQVNSEIGAVHFFLLPIDFESFLKRSKELLSNDEIIYLENLLPYLQNIEYNKLFLNLNIEIIEIYRNDRIIDIKNKIVDRINEKYDI